jgi:hypothetical protein
MGKIHGLTEAEISRIIRAAKKEGCHAIEVVKGATKAVVRFDKETHVETNAETSEWDTAIARASG